MLDSDIIDLTLVLLLQLIHVPLLLLLHLCNVFFIILAKTRFVHLVPHLDYFILVLVAFLLKQIYLSVIVGVDFFLLFCKVVNKLFDLPIVLYLKRVKSLEEVFWNQGKVIVFLGQ